MKNKIVLSYRFIILVYYLLAFLIVIMNINHLERVLIYSLILIVLFGSVVHIYILNIPKLLLSNKYIEKNLSTVKEAIDKIHNKSINDSLITIYIFLLEISNYKEEYQNFTIRVSGYAVKFIDLTREQQLDVIARTCHDHL